MPIPFDAANPSVDAAREVLLAYITANPNVDQLDRTGARFADFVEYRGRPNPAALAFAVQEAFWQLLIEGIVAPGMNHANMNLPFFHVTEYGRTVLAAGPANPHFPNRYLARLAERIEHVDPTVESYLSESLHSFRRGNIVASSVMLGIAAERVFLVLCESVIDSLEHENERDQLRRILDRFPMRPKLDWVRNKFQEQAVRNLPDFPDNAQIAILSVYDLLRTQRNELGHPREEPPSVDREDAFSNLQVFVTYYHTVERIREILDRNQI